MKPGLTYYPQDEAYELGRQWSKCYEPDSPARQLITHVMDDYLLVNVVHNDFKRPNAIFEPFFKAGADYALKHGAVKPLTQEPQTNGHANGHVNGHTNGDAH